MWKIRKVKQMWASVNESNGPLFGPVNGPLNGAVNGPVNGYLNGYLILRWTIYSMVQSMNSSRIRKKTRHIWQVIFADMNKKLRKEVSAVSVVYIEFYHFPIIYFFNKKALVSLHQCLYVFMKDIFGFFKSPIWSFVMPAPTCLYKLVKQCPSSKFIFVCF